MEKIYYTSCAKSVFSREAGRQIYTCSRGLNFQVRQIADNYIKMLVMSASSQVRNVYTKHDDLGYVYAQIKAGGSDAAGRQNNEFCQLIFDTGDNSVLPIEVFLRPEMFIEGLSREQIEGRVEPTFLPQFPPLAETEVKWSQLDAQKENNRWQTICELVDALIECKKHDKKLIICDKNTKMITAWILCLSMCLPRSMVKDVTFDTYTPNPFKAKERILGVCTTAGKSVVEEYVNNDQFIVFDLVNKQSNYKMSNLYTEQMASWQQNVGKNMQNLIELYHQEIAALSNDESVYEYMNEIAKLHAFLYQDVSKLFATNDYLNERMQFIEYGKTFRKYHSGELKEMVYSRFERVIGESGKPETFIELKQILSDELYQQDRTRIDEICHRAIGEVLIAHGVKKAYEFFEKATAKDSKDNRTRLAKKLVELVLGDIKLHFSKVEESDFNGTLKNFVRLLTEVGTTEQKEQTIEWMNEYFKDNFKRLSIEFFKNRDEILFKYLNDVSEELIEKTYSDMIRYVVAGQTVNKEYVDVIRARNKELFKEGKEGWTYRTIDRYVERFKERYNANKDVIEPLKFILKEFSEKEEAKHLNEKLRQELPQCLAELEDSLAENNYNQYKTELSEGFKTLKKDDNEGLIIPLFNYALRHGKDRASVVVEWVKADVGDRSLVIDALNGQYPAQKENTGTPDYFQDTIPQLIRLVKREKRKVRLPLIKAFTEEFVAYSIAENAIDKYILDFLYRFRKPINNLSSPDGILLVSFAFAKGSKKIEKCLKDVISSYREPTAELKPLLEMLAHKKDVSLDQDGYDEGIGYCFTLLFKTNEERLQEMKEAEERKKQAQKEAEERKRQARQEAEERKKQAQIEARQKREVETERKQKEKIAEKAEKAEKARKLQAQKAANKPSEDSVPVAQQKKKASPIVENNTIPTVEERKALEEKAKQTRVAMGRAGVKEEKEETVSQTSTETNSKRVAVAPNKDEVTAKKVDGVKTVVTKVKAVKPEETDEVKTADTKVEAMNPEAIDEAQIAVAEEVNATQTKKDE